MSNNVIEFVIAGKDKFSGAFKKVTGSIESTAKAVRHMGTAAALTEGAIVGFVTVIGNGEDKIAKFSRRIGVAVDQMSRMGFVSNQAGIGTDSFNMAAQRMTRRVSEASQGMGQALASMNALGISASSFKQLGIDQQMAVLADKIQNVKDPADQLRIAFNLFDSDGTAMLQMLKGGSEAMRKAANDADYLGVTISKQAAANAEQFTNSMGRATASVKGVSRGIADELMPVMSGMADAFANKLADARGSIVDFVKIGMKWFFTLGAVLNQFWTGFKKAFTSVDGFSAFLDNLGAFVVVAAKAVFHLGEMIFIGIWEGLKAAGKIVSGFAVWLWDEIKTGGDAGDFSDTMAKTIGDALTAASKNLSTEMSGPLDEFKKNAAEAGRVAADAFGINLKDAQKQAQATIDSLVEYGNAASETVKNLSGQNDAYLQAMSVAHQQFLVQAGQAYQTFANSFYGSMNTAIDGISNAMATVVVSGGNLISMFKQVAAQVVTQLVAAWIKMGIQRAITAAANKAANVADASTNMATASATTYGNAFAATAAIPIIGPAAAPAAATAAVTAMLAGASASGAAGAATGAGIAGVAHAGMTNVPREATYLLNKNERVLSPQQNSDLTSFLNDNPSRGGDLSIGNLEIHMFENASDISDLRDLDKNELKERFAVPLIEAFDELAKQGVTFQFIRRKL